MKRKITINKNTSRVISGRLTIPLKLLEYMGITENDRAVSINLEGNKLIIEKVEDSEMDLVEITQEERDYLLL